MTLHLQASQSVAQKILSFLKSLQKDGEDVQIIDEGLYIYEKEGIQKALQQLKNNQIHSADEILQELEK